MYLEFNPASFKAIVKWPKTMQTEWNTLTRLLFQCLREANGGFVRTNIITDYVIAATGREISDPKDWTAVRLSVHYRLKNLARQKLVIRHHDRTGGHRAYGSWSLPAETDRSADDLEHPVAGVMVALPVACPVPGRSQAGAAAQYVRYWSVEDRRRRSSRQAISLTYTRKYFRRQLWTWPSNSRRRREK